MINMPSGEHQEVENLGSHYDIGPTVLSSIGFDNCQAFGFGRNMLSCGVKGNPASSRNGRLLELFPADKHLIKIAGHTRIKSFVRTKWGDFLGGIISVSIESNNS